MTSDGFAGPKPGPGRAALLAVAALGILLVFLVLAAPNRYDGLRVHAFLHLPLELPALILTLALVPRRMQPALRWIFLTAIGCLLLLKVADMGAHAAYGRIFDPVFQWRLLGPGWNVLAGSIGPGMATAMAAAAAAAFVLLLVLLHWSLRRIAGAVHGPLRRRAAIGMALALGVSAIAAGASAAAHPSHLPALRLSTALLAEHVRLSLSTARNVAAFAGEAASDPADAIPSEALLAGLRGKDVILVFVESYGRSAVEDPLYAPTIQARLAAFDQALSGAGFQARSTWLTSPTVGGQSWLAHGTLLSGLWIDNQQRYDLLMGSRRAPLNDLFKRAGWRTVAVMPAITMPWPEAGYFGYDQTYTATGLGYRGDPFNWVTMPDQFTLAALQRLEIEQTGRPPVMAEIALISSHAPWTPIPPVLPWADVGDGSVFNPFANAGDPPSVVWSDPDRIRAQYLLAIDYTLATLASFIESTKNPDLVFIILGDHQPAAVITGPDASRDVPVHLVTADPAVLARIADWGWTIGMQPAGDAVPWRMDQLRGRLIRSFSSPAGQAAAASP